jgi:presqualene diphosphate synthase
MSAVAEETTTSEAKASGSSFYTAMRILPAAKRDAMYAVYRFCREVDDIADEGGTDEERRAGLEQWRRDMDAVFSGGEAGQAAFLVKPVKEYGLKRQDFQAVIDGMEMDVGAGVVAPDWKTLDLYVDRVACAVGRLSTPVFGLDSATGEALSHHLGRALQLTNILRDLDEDAAIGRLYLPREELEKAGMKADLSDPAAVLGDPAIDAVCRVVAARAETHFQDADRIMASAPRVAVRAPRLMGVAYHGVLKRLVAQGWAAPRTRVGVNKLGLVGAYLRYGVI